MIKDHIDAHMKPTLLGTRKQQPHALSRRPLSTEARSDGVEA